MSMLYERIEALCGEKGVTITEMCRGAGVARGSLTDLKMGRISQLSARTLTRLADYCGVTVGYLLGSEEKETPGMQAGRDVTFDDFTYAMYEEGKALTEENKKKLLEMAQFFRQQQEKET